MPETAGAGTAAHDASVVVTEHGVTRSGLAPPGQDLWLPPNQRPSNLRLERQPNGWCRTGKHWPGGWFQMPPEVEAEHGRKLWRRVCIRAGCEWQQVTSVDPLDPDHPDRQFIDEEQPLGEG